MSIKYIKLSYTSFLPGLEDSPLFSSLVLFRGGALVFALPNIICSTTIIGDSKAKVHKAPKTQQTNISAIECRI